MIDNTFRKFAIQYQTDNICRIMEASDWEKPTKMNIINNLLDKIGELISAKIIRSTVVNSKGEVTRKITIEYKEPEPCSQ